MGSLEIVNNKPIPLYSFNYEGIQFGKRMEESQEIGSLFL